MSTRWLVDPRKGDPDCRCARGWLLGRWGLDGMGGCGWLGNLVGLVVCVFGCAWTDGLDDGLDDGMLHSEAFVYIMKDETDETDETDDCMNMSYSNLALALNVKYVIVNAVLMWRGPWP